MMMDITASGSFRALAEAIRLHGLVKAQDGHGPLEDLRFSEAATVIAAH